MDTNFIRKDGFSNPETERLFKETCTEEQMEARCEKGKHCGLCTAGEILVDSPDENLWLLCMNEESPYFLETVHFAFTCAHHMPGREGELIDCPWRPSPPVTRGDARFGLGVEDEDE